MVDGRYRPTRHFDERCDEYQVTILDIPVVFKRCSFIEPHTDMPKHDGTCWRAFGPNVDGTMELAIGFEAFIGDNGVERVVLCTILPPRERP